jgi:hypothetical protein
MMQDIFLTVSLALGNILFLSQLFSALLRYPGCIWILTVVLYLPSICEKRTSQINERDLRDRNNWQPTVAPNSSTALTNNGSWIIVYLWA